MPVVTMQKTKTSTKLIVGTALIFIAAGPVAYGLSLIINESDNKTGGPNNVIDTKYTLTVNKTGTGQGTVTSSSGSSSPQYILTVNKTGTGQGTVTSSSGSSSPQYILTVNKSGTGQGTVVSSSE